MHLPVQILYLYKQKEEKFSLNAVQTNLTQTGLGTSTGLTKDLHYPPTHSTVQSPYKTPGYNTYLDII